MTRQFNWITLGVFFTINFNLHADTLVVELKTKFKKSDHVQFHYFKIPQENEKKDRYVLPHFHGEYREYFFDGKIKEQGTYKDNYKVGEWKSFYPNSKINSVENYGKNGGRHGKFEYYQQNGQLINTGEYYENTQIGNWYSYTYNKRSNKFDEKITKFPSLEEHLMLEKKKLYESIKISCENKRIYSDTVIKIVGSIPYPRIDAINGVSGKVNFSFSADSICNLIDFKMNLSISNSTDTICKIVAKKVLECYREKGINCQRAPKNISLNFSLE